MIFEDQYNIVFNFMQSLDAQLKQQLGSMINMVPSYVVDQVKQGEDFECVGLMANYYLINIDDSWNSTEIEFGASDSQQDRQYLLNLRALSPDFFDQIPMLNDDASAKENFEDSYEIGTFNVISNEGVDMQDYVVEIIKKKDGFHAILTCNDFHNQVGDNQVTKRQVDKPITNIDELVAYVDPNTLN